MRRGATVRKGQGNGVGWLVVAVVVVGGLFLYQRDGGKVFGPQGVVGPAAPARPTVGTFTSRRDEGAFSHDLYYTYTGPAKLEDVDLTVTFYFDKGAKPAVKRFYAVWLPNEEKKLNVSAADGIVQKHELSGTARRGGVAVVVEAVFTKPDPAAK